VLFPVLGVLLQDVEPRRQRVVSAWRAVFQRVVGESKLTREKKGEHDH
jgi:hypothetical protein